MRVYLFVYVAHWESKIKRANAKGDCSAQMIVIGVRSTAELALENG